MNEIDWNKLLTEIEEILDGIDRVDIDDGGGGWWPSSIGASFGKDRIELIRNLINNQKGEK